MIEPTTAMLVDALPLAELPAEEWRDQPFTWLGRMLDRAALSGMRLLLNALLRIPEADMPLVRASAEPYLTPELEAEPRRFFAFLDAPPAPAPMTSRRRRRLPDGQIVAREFATQYEPYHRRPGWREYPENDVVTVEHWMHRPGAPRGTVIALHGFTMGRPWIDAHALMATRWFDLGFDVALLTLPFHGPRSPAQSRYSGEMFASWDVGQLNEAVRQAVHDIHLVKHWLRRETGGPVGLFGLSLGGYLAALMAGLCSDPEFVIPLVPPICLGALPSRLLATQGLAATPPMSLEEMRRAYRVHMPTTYPLAVDPERVLIIGARGDCVVPPEHAHALWHHWGRPNVHWFSGSHSALFRRPLATRVAEHLAGLGLLEEAAVAA